MGSASGDDDLALVPTEAASGVSQTQHTPSAVTVVDLIPRGSSVGRYMVLDVLGKGGMGVVYTAYDPDLDRKVAIKLLQSRGDSTWLLREAQALARLAHPNVVAVFDVGTLSDNRVFIAMELVDGLTLRAWLAAQPRTWREIIPVMLAAGAGLVAAHAVDLVHRDFKPENVIVGSDGRVRVMDFGLARFRRDEDHQPPMRSSATHLDDTLTNVGTVIGTPAYMAPELHDGHEADVRTDQFAFGVTLYEALFRALPYDRNTLRHGTAVAPTPPENSKVPARIQRVVLRAISLAHADRFDSMTTLLRELAIDPAARRRRMWLAAAAAFGIAAIIGITFALSRSEPVVCRGADQRLAGVWDVPTKEAIRRAYAASELPIAARSFDALARALDAYAKDWVAASTESCEATRVRRDQTEEVLSLRQTCLDRRLEELRALTQVLAKEPSQTVIEKSAGVVSELEPLARCANVAALREPTTPRDPRTTLLDKQLASAKADMISGRYLPALVTAKKVTETARQIHYTAAEAEAHVVRGVALLAVQNGDDAIIEFAAGVQLGIASRRDDLAAKSAFAAATVDAAMRKRPREARIWLTIGIPLAERAEDIMIDIARLDAEGIVASENGDPLGAIAAHEQMFAIASRYSLPGQPMVVDAAHKLATTLTRGSAYARATKMFERVIKDQQTLLGPDHPHIAITLSNLGLCYSKLRNAAKARDVLERSIALRERLFGTTSPLLIPALDNYADMLKATGSVTEALPVIERAMNLAKVDRTSINYHTVATTYAEILALTNRRAEARALLDDVLKLEETTSSPTLSATLSSRAELALEDRAWRDAAAFASRAITALEAEGSVNNPDLWRPLSVLGRAKLELGERADARIALERALAIGAKTELPATTFEATRGALARL